MSLGISVYGCYAVMVFMVSLCSWGSCVMMSEFLGVRMLRCSSVHGVMMLGCCDARVLWLYCVRVLWWEGLGCQGVWVLWCSWC